MADSLVDLKDSVDTATEPYNGETDGQNLCKSVENNVVVYQDDFLPEPNGNCVEITSENFNNIDGNSTVEKILVTTSKKSSLRRRPPVLPKPILVKYRSNKGSNGYECPEAQNETDSLNISAETNPSQSLDDNLIVRKREGRSSRETRNSAGASGGIFSEDYQPEFEEYHEEIDEITNELENENEMAEAIEPLQSPTQEDMGEDFSDFDKHRILSIGGDDKNARIAIVFSASRLPPKTEIDHQKLFRYMMYTLDQYVENDYSVVYFHHGLNSKNKPSISWLVQVYHALDRKYKKNLKALFIVHPTGFIKVIWNVLKQFISAKFAQKVVYANRLSELEEHLHLAQLDIPELVKKHDEEVSAKYKPKYPPAVFHTDVARRSPQTQQFGVSLDRIRSNTGDEIPTVVQSSVEFLRKSGLEVEGLFRRSANVSVVKGYAERFNRGEVVQFVQDEDTHVAAVLLKKFLRDLPEPLLTFQLSDELMRIHGSILCFEGFSPLTNYEVERRNQTLDVLPEEEKVDEVKRVLKAVLPQQNYLVLKYLMVFLVEVINKAHLNKMNASNLAIVFGPNLIWTQSAVASLSAMGPINSVTKIIIENVHAIFD